MKAEAKGFKFLSLEGKVKIPFFQRSYVWDKDNWEDLLSELLNKPEGHFLGSIILKQLPTSSGAPKELEVVDGQQRLTTLSILLKALYDTFSPELKENCKGVVWELLFYRTDFVSGKYEIKIEHSQVDANAYQSVIQANTDSRLEDVKENSHKILQCYKYFLTELQSKPEDERRTLFNRILAPENKMLVVIDLVESDDEQAIFDTLNTAGVRLTTAEIIKNAIFQQVLRVYENKESAIELYKKTWEKTFLADEDTIKYWETERLTGRLKRDNIEILLHCIAVIEGFFDPDKHTLSDLSKLYKERISKKNSKEELETFINEITEYAQIYREKIITFDRNTLFSFNDPIKRLLHILDELQISTFHPFILFVLKRHQNDESQIVDKFTRLEKFIVRRMIAKQTTKNYNKNCKEFIRDFDSSVKELLKETTDDQISNGLRSISNKNAAILLFWVELHRRNQDAKYDIKELKYAYSLEHIMPQKWEEHWQNIPKKYNSDGSEMTDEEAKKDRDNKVYWIGNMILLTSSLNTALRNHNFTKKMNGEGRKKGIKAYAELSITKDDLVAPFDNGDTNWDENKIIERTEKLEEEIKEIWRNN